MSTFAIDPSEQTAVGGARRALGFADLFVLALALPVFLLASLPMLGYVAIAGAWLIQRGAHWYAEGRAKRLLAAGERRSAMATVGVTTLGRVWFLALVVLLTGLADREAGLAAAVTGVALFTLFIAGQGVAHIREEGVGR
ncbi:hypothetical protein HJD18_04825 [Thermoleophilia bacterium SCSIO 60948]|nr:hypothetical protein HJD18_04825 [Thermoleophilia bacterium SCSIO 60948]